VLGDDQWRHGVHWRGVSRNQTVDEPVTLFENGDPQKTTILQEYFVPPASLASLLSLIHRPSATNR
jgi:hypothetical protein